MSDRPARLQSVMEGKARYSRGGAHNEAKPLCLYKAAPRHAVKRRKGVSMAKAENNIKAFKKALDEAGVNANTRGQRKAPRKERRAYLFSTGLYAEYRALTMQQAIELAPSLEWHAHGGSAEECLAALFDDRQKHMRSYHAPAKGKRAPISICAHRVAFALPKGMGKNALSIVEDFLHAYDSRTRFLTWGFRVIDVKGVLMAEIMIFTRPVLAQPVEEVRRWDSDYYWNTRTKKRASKDAFEKDTEGVIILRYRKGQPMLDSSGNRQTETITVSRKEVPLFRYCPGKGTKKELSGFEIMMERIKGTLLEVLCAFGMPSVGRSIVPKCSYKKGKYRSSTLIKVRDRNRLITLVNRHLARIRMSIEAAGFEECDDVMGIWRAFRCEIAKLCHADSFTFHNIHVTMNYRGFFSEFSERLSMLRSLLEEKFRVFYIEYAKLMEKYGLGSRENTIAAGRMINTLTPSAKFDRYAQKSMNVPRGENINDLGV